MGVKPCGFDKPIGFAKLVEVERVEKEARCKLTAGFRRVAAGSGAASTANGCYPFALCLIALQMFCSALNSAVSRFSFDRLISTSTNLACAALRRARSANSG